MKFAKAGYHKNGTINLESFFLTSIRALCVCLYVCVCVSRGLLHLCGQDKP